MKSWKAVSGALLVFAGFCAGVGLNFKTVHSAPGDPNPALKAVAHDGTLAGDGTTSAPLGIANGGVSAPKLSTAASPTEDQLLGFRGGNLAWRNTPLGGVRVVDSLGHDVGPLFIQASVLRKIGGLTVHIGVSPAGFPSVGLSFYHTTNDCSGTRYLALDIGDLIRGSEVAGATLYYPADPAQQISPLSVEQITSSGQPGGCFPVGAGNTVFAGLPATFDLSRLGLTPPFHVEF